MVISGGACGWQLVQLWPWRGAYLEQKRMEVPLLRWNCMVQDAPSRGGGETSKSSRHSALCVVA